MSTVNVQKGRQLELPEIQSALLSMLKRFDAFCRAHDLDYSIWAGTLLGAARHGGFIPWDDDADLGIARPQLDRLVAMADEFHRETGMRIVGFPDVSLDIAPLVKIVDERVVVRPANEISESFLWIDLNPVDGMPESAEELSRVCGEAHRLRLALSVVTTTVASGRTPVRRFVKALCVPLRGSKAYKRFIARRLKAISTAVPYGSTAYVGNISWGIGQDHERLGCEQFEQHIDMPFEGATLRAMSCWEEYLDRLYWPHWQQVPPPEKRKVHSSRAWLANGATLEGIVGEADD